MYDYHSHCETNKKNDRHTMWHDNVISNNILVTGMQAENHNKKNRDFIYWVYYLPNYKRF